MTCRNVFKTATDSFPTSITRFSTLVNIIMSIYTPYIVITTADLFLDTEFDAIVHCKFSASIYIIMPIYSVKPIHFH